MTFVESTQLWSAKDISSNSQTETAVADAALQLDATTLATQKKG